VVVVDVVVVVGGVVVVVEESVVVVVVEVVVFWMSKIAGHPESNSMAVTAASTRKLRCFMVAPVLYYCQYPTAISLCK
jgi:hypothetical protein